MVVGALLNNYAVLWKGNSSVMMTSYVPIRQILGFYVGLILFAVGALIHLVHLLGTLVIAKSEKTYEGSVPLGHSSVRSPPSSSRSSRLPLARSS